MATTLFVDERQLRQIGFDARMIDTFRELALFADALKRLTNTEGAITDINTATTALDEALEDANLSIASLDTRLDVLEADAPYVEVSGDTMSGPLNVNALLECDSLRINTAPVVAAAVASTHTVAVNLNGATYYLLASNV